MSFITDPLVYYPISGILWFWHKIFAFLGGFLPWVEAPDSNGAIWALSVIFLVVTLRILLFWPAAKQIRFSRKMQEMQPRMKELQKRYKNDREKLATETRKLQKAEGFNPVLGCLPMFIQIPVFLGLFHVLRSFNRMGNNFGALGMTAEETRNTGNYVFNADEVQSFLDARLFGSPLSSFISQPVEQFQAFVDPGAALDFQRWNIIVVAIPLMIISAVTTHLNARISLSRQSPEAAANPQAKIMNQLMLWAFPIGILVTGAFWPLAILVYMVTNNLWTLGQQYYLFEKMAKEDDAAALKRREEQKSLAPRVGVKPVNPKRGRGSAAGTAVAPQAAATGVASPDDDGTTAAPAVVGDAPESAPGSAPRPGQRPQRPGGQRTRPAQKGGGGGGKGKKKKRKR
ncbi:MULTISPECIES: membrane protein insertase YidC [unclassified Dietzia]|uniref:membrane protein insertase YidC n=1 Tax=unclassified Dietzia TaxID=2617939 RepID=UPI000D208A99|nr:MULTISPECIES: membrane protein insertase YidC [unclassified Dietzia]AVZ40940.1 membrane protein insertase YidC [Dietzia sp. JS16-p6b]MBB1023191.1 membrane protein insertase YidC [Dietzia sp. DQ12-76]MBB1027104.1 membrane protein insertase YidC [Dietzia sp. DQ11-38-2]QGW26583.1 putative inner membrane protein translocase component YidC [Dietzia sp. DQ12-45-1b]